MVRSFVRLGLSVLRDKSADEEPDESLDPSIAMEGARWSADERQLRPWQNRICSSSVKPQSSAMLPIPAFGVRCATEGVQIVENSFIDSRPLGVRLRRAQNAIKREPQAVAMGRWFAFAANHGALPAVDEKRG